MFYLNLGHRWKLASVLDRLDGVLLLPQGNSSEKVVRARLQDFPRVLLDPQLYLADLDAQKCQNVCARLASYPWFCVDGLQEFDSGAEKRTEWEKRLRSLIPKKWPGHAPSGKRIREACESCIEFQQTLSCSQVILPAPLITEREDEVQLQANWLDEGLEAAEDLDITQPLLASIPVLDTVLNEAAFEEGGFLDSIADQVTARENIDGVYIVIAKSQSGHPFETEIPVLRAYAWLAQVFGAHGYDTVLANFCDVFGLVCRGLGASSFATGPSQSLRQLSLPALNDQGFGISLPHLYAHRLIGELRTEKDLDKIVKARLVRRIRDLTPYSRPLIQTLSRGGSAADLPDWAESRNNTTAAHRHFITRMVAVEQQLRAQPSEERADAVRDWLEDAEANSLYIRRRLRPEKILGRIAPAATWLNLFEETSD